MKTRTIFLLVAAFVVLGVVASIPIWSDDGGGVGGNKLGFGKFSESSVTKVVITAKGKSQRLVRDKGAWTYNGKRAQSSEVRGFFNVLRASKVGDLVSKNKAHHSNFAVTPQDGTVLDLTTNDGTTSYVIGKSGDVPRTFYARKAGSDNVYEVTGDLPGRLTQAESVWTSSRK
jgi:hypothetical protein